MEDVEIQLVAFNVGLYYAWKEAFADIEAVDVLEGDILAHRADAIVSPANSFGYMDGGLDLKYSQHFGWELERRLRALLERDYYGELPVGQAVVVETAHPDIPYLISAPTMRVPMNVAKTAHAYLAFRAVLHAVKTFNRSRPGTGIRSVLCPGLCTGEGRMPYERCAYQMVRAYRLCVYGEIETKGGLAKAVRDHIDLIE